MPDSLTELGIKQAEALSKRLQNCNLDEIYASTSNRAIMTAQPTCEKTGLSLTELDWCNEMHAWKDLSVIQSNGRPMWGFQSDEIIEIFNSPAVRSLGDKWYTYEKFAGTGFESGTLRIQCESDLFLEKLGYKHDRDNFRYVPTQHSEKRVALFAHQGFGLAFLSAVLDIPYPLFCTRFDMGHSGMTVIEFEPVNGYVIPKVLQLSNDSHIYKEGIDTVYQNRIKF
jgi:probable phosphoglycerate mutase